VAAAALATHSDFNVKILCGLFLLGLTACSFTSRVTAQVIKSDIDMSPTKVLRHFQNATAAAADQFQNVYVIESSGNSLIKLSSNGDSLRAVSGFGSGQYQFNGPVDIDARLTNSVFIADKFNHRIIQYSKDLNYVSTLYTRENSQPAQRFGYPNAVASDDGGNIYVADGENKRIVKFRPDHSFERSFGGYSDATRPEAVLTNPTDLAVDRNQHLIVLDNGGTSLAEYDNLGNFLARTLLNEVGSSIIASRDILYAVIPARNVVRLFQLPDLSNKGSWSIPDSTKVIAWNPTLISFQGAFALSPTSLLWCAELIASETIK
jgi:DNA-binding beta-propeller fold protein YncE